MVVLASAFWSSSGAEYRRIHSSESNRMGLSEALFCTPSARVTWVTAAFLLCYVGVEVALGGWIVIFMIRVRHGEAFASGMSAVGFWLGITAGRAVLGFVTPRVGVKLSTAVSFCVPPVLHGHALILVALHCCRGRSRTHLLARTAILRICSGSRFPRLLPGPNVPQRSSRGSKAATTPASCRGHRICRRFWRLRCGRVAVSDGYSCAGKGSHGSAADCAGIAGRHAGDLALLSACRDEKGMK